MKKCKDCKIKKPLSTYHKNKGYKDGYLPRCKPCRRIQRGQKERFIPLTTDSGQQCTGCREHKSFDCFYESSRAGYKYRSRCILCTNKDNRQYHHSTPTKQQKRGKLYRDNNKDKVCAASARRRAAVLQRTPKWLTADDWKWIAWHYKHSQVMSQLHGEPYEVDHILPLQGELVSGFHVPWNMQVITQSENRSKSGKFTP